MAEAEKLEEPQFVHDCTRCKFLGRFEFDGRLTKGTEHFKCDLYVCETAIPFGPTLLGRFSDDGPDYVSTPIELVERDEKRLRTWETQATHTPAVIEALDRYRKHKLS